MIGNGNGISRGDNNEDKDLYLYWSSEWVFGGKGGRRQGWKLYAWEQTGKRTILDETVSSTDTQNYDRTRWGVGTTFRKSKYRAAFEYIAADGMIQNGTDGAAVAGTTNAGGAVASWNMLPEDKADGMYLDFGFLVIPSLELDVRYDVLNRATDVATNERKFETWTLGAQYFFNKKTRMILNYEFRSAEAPNLPGSHPANQILDGIDDRASLQVLAVF
jgi:predicted porin